MVANVDKMMYVGKEPWHGEGTRLENVATSADAIVAAGLDWNVDKRQVQYLSADGESKNYKGKFVTVRADREIPLGIVGHIYRPLQNKEAFSFFDAVVGTKEAMYHTAGSLGKGEKIWILAQLPGSIQVTHEDKVEKYLLLANSHDGSSAVEMMFTPIRVVCQNTLNMALNSYEQGKKIRMRHTISLGQKVLDVREQLGIINNQYNMFEELSQKMVGIQQNQKEFIAYLEQIGVITKEEDETYSKQTEQKIEDMVYLYEHGKGNDMKTVAGTLWASMNAVVEYTDHVRGTDGNRTKSILYGSGAGIKQKAWDLAVAKL